MGWKGVCVNPLLSVYTCEFCGDAPVKHDFGICERCAAEAGCRALIPIGYTCKEAGFSEENWCERCRGYT